MRVPPPIVTSLLCRSLESRYLGTSIQPCLGWGEVLASRLGACRCPGPRWTAKRQRPIPSPPDATGIFSDVHANLEALSAVIEAYRHERIDRYFCLGDVVGYGANPNECANIVRDVAELTILAITMPRSRGAWITRITTRLRVRRSISTPKR